MLTIRLAPDPILFRKARKIARITAQHRKLAADMVETMIGHHGVGLAANQVGVLERLCVIQTHDMEDAMILVNPEIVRREGEREVEEGCLSVPGYRGMVLRAERVRARALDLNSRPFKVDAEELLAQALEHEIDHLNGIMYMDHLVAHTRLYPVKEAGEDDEFGAEHEREDNSEHQPSPESRPPEYPPARNPDFDPVYNPEYPPAYDPARNPVHDPVFNPVHSPDFDSLHRRLHEMRANTEPDS